VIAIDCEVFFSSNTTVESVAHADKNNYNNSPKSLSIAAIDFVNDLCYISQDTGLGKVFISWCDLGSKVAQDNALRCIGVKMLRRSFYLAKIF